MARPDALMMPANIKVPSRYQYRRIDSICTLAERLLEVDKTKGEQVYVRNQPPGLLFVSLDPHDTMLFPKVHPQSGKHRYRWEDSSEIPGAQLGYLVEQAIDGEA